MELEITDELGEISGRFPLIRGGGAFNHFV